MVLFIYYGLNREVAGLYIYIYIVVVLFIYYGSNREVAGVYIYTYIYVYCCGAVYKLRIE